MPIRRGMHRHIASLRISMQCAFCVCDSPEVETVLGRQSYSLLEKFEIPKYRRIKKMYRYIEFFVVACVKFRERTNFFHLRDKSFIHVS